MLDSIAHLADYLKKARQEKKWSQRELSIKTKVPQGHISKIENGTVDLQTSSLIEISRALDLELMLIPRSLVPTIKFLLNSGNKNHNKQIPEIPA